MFGSEGKGCYLHGTVFVDEECRWSQFSRSAQILFCPFDRLLDGFFESFSQRGRILCLSIATAGTGRRRRGTGCSRRRRVLRPGLIVTVAFLSSSPEHFPALYDISKEYE